MTLRGFETNNNSETSGGKSNFVVRDKVFFNLKKMDELAREERRRKYIQWQLMKLDLPDMLWKDGYPSRDMYCYHLAVYITLNFADRINQVVDWFIAQYRFLDRPLISFPELFALMDRKRGHDQEMEEGKEAKRMKKEPEELEAIIRSKIPLFDFQKQAVHRMVEQRGTCLCYATGNGKSLVAVTATQQLLIDNPYLQIVVIAPLSLLSNFQLSLERYGVARDHPAYEYFTYEGFAIAYKKDQDMLVNKVVVFDEVHHIRTDVHTSLKQKHKSYTARINKKPEEDRTDTERLYVSKSKAIKEALKEVAKKNNTDPIEYVKEKTGVNIMCIAPRSLLAINAVRESFKVICLTATPFFNSSYDLVPLICMMRGETVYTRRYFSYMVANRTEFVNKCRGLFLFKDVEKNDRDFPQVTTHKIDLMMSPEYYQEYHEIENEIESKTRQFNLDKPWVFLSGLRRALMSLQDAVKPKYALEIAAQGYKTIIFSVFKSQGIHLVAKGLEQMKIPYVEITGDISEELRETYVQRFNGGEDVKDEVNVVLITAAGGEGLDFRGVRKMVCLEMEWNEAQLKQAMGRAPRRKSHHHLEAHQRVVDIYLLCLVKPLQRNADDHISESADQMLRRHTQKKLKEIEPVERLLRSIQ